MKTLKSVLRMFNKKEYINIYVDDLGSMASDTIEELTHQTIEFLNENYKVYKIEYVNEDGYEAWEILMK